MNNYYQYKRNCPHYVFCFIQKTQSGKQALKEILLTKRLCPKDGVIRFYAPFYETSSAFHAMFPDNQVYGLGFIYSSLKTLIESNGQVLFEDTLMNAGNIRSFITGIKEFDFSTLDYRQSHVFAVVPSLKAQEEVCFHGVRPGTEYKRWWWKGIRNDCQNYNDKDIENYLHDYRFFRDNHVEAERKDVFPITPLFGTSPSYTLLSTPPNQLANPKGKVYSKSKPLFEGEEELF